MVLTRTSAFLSSTVYSLINPTPMAYSVANLVEQLPHWQHASSTRLQGLDLLTLCRENPGPIDDPTVIHALKRGCMDAREEALQYDAAMEVHHTLQHTQSRLNSCSEACNSLSKALTAPIRKLSDDVLVTIFDLACTDVPLSIKIGSTWDSRTHYSLASVCYRWKELLFNTPSLWTGVEVQFIGQPESEQIAEDQLRSLRELILRSRQSPLRITIYFDRSSEMTPFQRSVHDFLAPHLDSRCQSLSFVGRAMPVTFYPLQWSMLHSLHIQRDFDFPDLSINLQPQRLTMQLPALRNLELEVCPSRLNFKLGIEWHRLTRLKAEYWELQQVQQILSACISLEELTLYNPEENDPMEGSQVSCSLQSLRHLSLCEHTANLMRFSGPGDMSPFLRMPSLQSLVLESWTYTTFNLQRFMDAFSCYSLTSLVVCINMKHLLELRSLLRQHRNYSGLETFSLEVANASTRVRGVKMDMWERCAALFLEMKAEAGLTESSSILLPQLTKFELEISQGYAYNEEVDGPTSRLCRKALTEMVHSRHDPPHGVSRLRSLGVFVDVWDFTEFAEVIDLKGMQVILRDYY